MKGSVLSSKINQCVMNYDLVTAKCKTDGAEGAIVYGIRISSDHSFAEIEDISVNQEYVEELLYLLKKGKVSPDQFFYIVEDYVARW